MTLDAAARQTAQHDQAENGRLPDATLEDAGLEDATLEDAGLEDTELEDTELEDTTLEDTDLEDTTLEDTGLEDTRLEDTRLEELTLADQQSESVDQPASAADEKRATLRTHHGLELVPSDLTSDQREATLSSAREAESAAESEAESAAGSEADSEAESAAESGVEARGQRPVASFISPLVTYVRHPGNARYIALLAISIVALVVSLVDFGLISGEIQLPAPGLQTQGTVGLQDRATYGFEFDTDGWQARGAATGAVWNNSHEFAGQGALELQITGLSDTQKAFIFITVPPSAKPGSLVTAHVYVPSGAPPLVATLYALDGSWAWSSGAYPSLNPGAWTAVTYAIPKSLQGPVREMGVMIIGAPGGQPYTGPMFLDSVNIQN